ncbi:MAG: hypothetical protein AAF512_00265 [Pseudomonadota bacterium]
MFKIPTSNKRLALLIGGFLLLNVPLALLFLPSPDSSNIADTGDEVAWKQLTVPGDEYPAALHATIEQRTPWYNPLQKSIVTPNGQQNNQQQVAQVVPASWKFGGVINEGGERYMLLLDAEKRGRRYQVGDKLPDESKLRAIYDDAIVVEKTKEDTATTERLGLYQ